MQFTKFIGWFFRSNEPKAQNARRIVKLIFLLGLFIALFWVIPVRSVIQALLRVDPWLFLIGVGLGLIVLFFTSLQLLPLIRNQGIQRNLTQIFVINLTVKFYLLFTPSNLIASGIRWYRFAQPEGKIAESFVALAFFRLFDTFLTLTIGLSFLLLSANQSIQVNPLWVMIPIIGIILAWVLITRYSLPLYNWIKARYKGSISEARFTNRKYKTGIVYLRAFLGKFEKLLYAASVYAKMPLLELLGSITSGIVAALIGIASGMVLARAIGINLDFLTMGWIQSTVSLTAQLPFTMAEGLGFREVTLVAILSIFNISADQALALSFLIFTRSLVIALIGGLIEAMDTLRHKRLPKYDPLDSKMGE